LSYRSCRRALMLAVCAVFTVAVPALAQPHPKTPAPAVRAGLAGKLSAGTSALTARWTPFIKEASKRFGIAEDWINAVMRMESGGHTRSADGTPIKSRAGAMGLMQLMPETYRDMQHEYGLGQDPYDPHDNVIAGAAYLHTLYQKFGFPKMFAAYNAGPATVDANSAGVRDLPDETRNYVRGIANILGTKARDPDTGAEMIPAAKAVPESTILQLTRPDGVQVEIDATTVTSISMAMPDEWAPGVRTVLSMGLRRQAVLEDPDHVTEMLKSRGFQVS